MENLNIKIDGDTKVIEVREGNALELRHPKEVNITGTIGAPAEYLSKRKDLINPKNCHVLYSYVGLFIKLVVDETNVYITHITGKTEINPYLKKFGINDGKTFTIKELKQFIKMNRFFFADNDENMKIVTNLEKFSAEIATKIEEHGTTRGDKKNLTEVSVKSNLDMKFNLNIPIFVGEPKSKFQVEICFDIRDNAVTVWLESSELQNLILTMGEVLINKNVEPFRKDFAVIEQ